MTAHKEMVERLRGLLDKATHDPRDRPWIGSEDGLQELHNVTAFIENSHGELIAYGHLIHEDRDLIVEAVNALPTLLALIEALVKERDEAVEGRDALLHALGWKTGPFRDSGSRKVILEDSAGLRPEMVKARQRAQDAAADRDLWQFIAGERVDAANSGLLIRIWRQFKEMRRRATASEARAAAAEGACERLRGALKPFARAADVKLCGKDWCDDQHFGRTDIQFHLTFGDLRRARQALSGGG